MVKAVGMNKRPVYTSKSIKFFKFPRKLIGLLAGTNTKCLLNLGHCLLLFINKFALNVMCNIMHYFGKVIVI